MATETQKPASGLAEARAAQALADMAQSLRAILVEMRKMSATMARMEMKRMR